MRSGRLWATTMFTALALAAVADPAALAGEVGGRNNTDLDGTTRNYDAAPGEVNRVSVSHRRGPFSSVLGASRVSFGPQGALTIADAVPVRVSTADTDESGCGSATPRSAYCHGGMRFGDSLTLLLGDGNDLLTVLGGRGIAGYGGAGDDTLVGGPLGEQLRGGPGNDTVKGRGGADRLYGDAGNDLLSGFVGPDRLVGGPGSDRISAYTGNDVIDSADGVAETVDCSAGIDTVRADRADRLVGCERVTRV